MALFTEKSFQEAHNPLSNYGGNDAFVKGQIYSINNGGDLYNYSNNLKSYSKALEDAKANDNDNFWTGLGDFFVGRGADKLKADTADEYVKAFSGNPYEFDGKNYDDVTSKIKTEQDFEQGRAFNGGLIGSLINPITQVGKAGADLASGIGGNWDAWNKRDHLSDVGALGETALMFLAPGAGKGANTLGKAIGKNALMGAGYGLAGGLRDMGSKDFDAGQLAMGTALGAGIGGAIGGITHGAGKVWNKYSAGEPVVKTADATPYQEALNNLKNNATGARYSDVATNLPTTQGLDLSRVSLDNLNEDTLKQMFKSGLKNVRGTTGANEATTALKGNKDLLQEFLKNGLPTTTETPAKLKFSQRLKNVGSNIPNMGKDIANTKAGTKVSNLLKTKKGKIGAGVGAGLLLTKLMGGGGNPNPEEMSDAEMQELYNYVYGGGQ